VVRPGGLKNRRLFWVLYTILLVAAIGFATWQGVLFFGVTESGREPIKLPDVRRSYGRIGPRAPEPTTGPGEMTGNALIGVGMKPLDADPGGLAPPGGSVRRWAFERRTGDEVEMMALYVWPGTFEAAAEYYKSYLGGKGMKFLGEQSKKTSGASTRPRSDRYVRSRRVFVFHGAKSHAAVTLRKSRKNDQMLLITVNLVYPEP
jgi:hypothetical protein